LAGGEALSKVVMWWGSVFHLHVSHVSEPGFTPTPQLVPADLGNRSLEQREGFPRTGLINYTTECRHELRMEGSVSLARQEEAQAV
jgi:hypothetical protein